jgi:D-arabinose 1-dehydrogenase-like Zn-dependent alcohol dehydrogenase
MRALQLKSFQCDPELVDLSEPEPGPGEVVIMSAVRARAIPTST